MLYLSLQVMCLKMNVNIKSVSPLNPNLTLAGWDPLLTSWLEDSAAAPPHCHSYGVVSWLQVQNGRNSIVSAGERGVNIKAKKKKKE